MTKSKNNIWVFILLPVLFLSAPAWAGPVLQLQIGNAGQVRFGSHGRSGIVGSGLSITDMTFGNEILNMFGGHLFFLTGRGDGQNGNTFSYGPGGKFAVRGCVDADSDNDNKCGGKGDIKGVLMSGTFLDAKLVKENGEILLMAQFVEQLNPALAALLNLPTQSIGNLDLVLAPSGQFRYWTLTNVNGGTLGLLPEPSSIVLMATSAVGLFLLLGSNTLLQFLRL